MTIIPEISDQYVIYGIRLTYDPTYEYRYVGLTGEFRKRCIKHISDSKNKNSTKYNTHRSCWMRRHFFAITFDILEVCQSFNELALAEEKWIHILSARGHRLTNHTLGGEGTVGYTHTASTREKMKENHWSRNGFEHPRKGKPVSAATRAKISESLRKHPEKPQKPRREPSAPKVSLTLEERIQRLSDLHSGKGNPFYGKTHTEESRQKQSRAQTGKKKSVTYSTCTHCGTHGGGGNMTRYHFNNCKLAPSN